MLHLDVPDLWRGPPYWAGRVGLRATEQVHPAAPNLPVELQDWSQFERSGASAAAAQIAPCSPRQLPGKELQPMTDEPQASLGPNQWARGSRTLIRWIASARRVRDRPSLPQPSALCLLDLCLF
jgi:hypothetical protein